MTVGLSLEDVLRGARAALQQLTPRNPAGVRVGVTQPQRTTHAERRGWKQRGPDLYGFFRTPLGAYPGRIANAASSARVFYITYPPVLLLTGPHWACFRGVGGEEYAVHFHPAPTDVDTGILTVEHAILEAHR